MKTCSQDPVACIDWIAIGIGEILKDGLTMSFLALALIVLVRYRSRQQSQAQQAHAESLIAYDEKKHSQTIESPWKASRS